MEGWVAPTPPASEITLGAAWLVKFKHNLEFSYTWTINDMTVIHDLPTGVVIKSPVFSPPSSNELKWSLRLYPYGTDEDSEGQVSLFLHLEPCKMSKVRAQFKFSIIDFNGKKYNIMGNEEFCLFQHGNEMPGYGYKMYIEYSMSLNKPFGVLVDDKLTILCEIKVLDVQDNLLENSSDVTPCKALHRQLLKDFELLFETQQYTDFKIIANKEEFPVHRAILSARSSVFAAMFEHDMKEREQNRVEITDMNSAALKEMLRFIYTDKVDNIEKIANDLLAAADKYALEKLKSMCEEALWTSLKIQNAADILILADVHSAEKLKTRTMEFITEHQNTTDVMATAGFTSMSTSHPYLVVEILRAMAARRNEDQQKLSGIKEGTS